MNVPRAWFYNLQRLRADRGELVAIPLSITIDSAGDGAAVHGLIAALKAGSATHPDPNATTKNVRGAVFTPLRARGT
jgi:hypothetical protein